MKFENAQFVPPLPQDKAGRPKASIKTDVDSST